MSLPQRWLLLILVLSHAASAQADRVTLVTGDVLFGVVSGETETAVLIDHPVLGRIEIPQDQIRVIEIGQTPSPPAAAKPTRVDAPRAGAPVVPPYAEPVKEPVKKPDAPESSWDSRLEIGANASFGNTETGDLRLGLVVRNEAPQRKTRLDATYYYREARGDSTDNQLSAGALQDSPLPDSRVLYFLQGRYEYDEFQSWDQRVTGGGGLGYQLIKEEELTLTIRTGGGAAKEFGSEEEELRPEMILGSDVSWHLTEKQQLVADSTVYPSLRDSGEFRSVSNASWTYKLDELDGVNLNVGLRHDYSSRTDPGIEHNDFRLYGGVAIDF